MIYKRLNKTGQAAAELAIFGTLILLAFSVLLMFGQRLEMQQRVKMEAFRKALQKAYERNSSVSYTLKKDSRPFNLFGGYGQGQPTSMSASASVMWQKGYSGEQDSDDQQQFAYYQVNEDFIGEVESGSNSTDIVLPRYEKLSTGFDGSNQTIKVPVSAYKEEIKKQDSYTASVTRNEAAGMIVSSKTSTLGETVDTQLRVRFDKSTDEAPWDTYTPPPEYVYEGESYTHEGTPHTISEVEPIAQGAYYNETTNRIDYREGAGGTIQRTRTWSTPVQ